MFSEGQRVRVIGKFFTGQVRIVARPSGQAKDWYLTHSEREPRSSAIAFPAGELEALPAPSIFNIGPSKEAPPHG
jgi:hypothetical protein